MKHIIATKDGVVELIPYQPYEYKSIHFKTRQKKCEIRYKVPVSWLISRFGKRHVPSVNSKSGFKYVEAITSAQLLKYVNDYKVSEHTSSVLADWKFRLVELDEIGQYVDISNYDTYLKALQRHHDSF